MPTPPAPGPSSVNAGVAGDGGSAVFSNLELIRRGIVFYATRRVNNLANNGSNIFHIQTGDAECFMEMTAVCEGAARVNLMEGDTYTDDGTLVPIYNRNRKSSLISQTQMWHTPTVNVSGTTIAQWLCPSTTKVTESYILAPNTSYTFEVFNVSGVSAATAIEIDFFERNLDLI